MAAHDDEVEFPLARQAADLHGGVGGAAVESRLHVGQGVAVLAREPLLGLGAGQFAGVVVRREIHELVVQGVEDVQLGHVMPGEPRGHGQGVAARVAEGEGDKDGSVHGDLPRGALWGSRIPYHIFASGQGHANRIPSAARHRGDDAKFLLPAQPSPSRSWSRPRENWKPA